MTNQTSPSAGNLPAEPNSFVGRERDLAELGLLLTDVRVLTLCGPGGIGKTRLGLRLATQLAPGFAAGAWLAELADLADPELLARRVAAVLGIRHEPDRTLADTLADALRSRELLLVLDTCEHVVDACAALVQHLAAACPGLRVIATSREPLRVRGETVWRVPPLELPAALEQRPAAGILGNEAVRLFGDRASAVRPGFTLTAGNAAAVARLCRTLDGIPLAIELAAARIRALSVEQVADRLSDRFALLASGDRTAPVRQQTLRAAVDWSYELLTEAEQVLLRRLSVFSGWSLEMAEQVCADKQIRAEDILDLLAALIDKSLVSMDAEHGGDARYRLLDTIGEYAAGRLAASGEESEIRAAHRDCLLQLGEDTVARAFVRGEPSWPERVVLYHRIAAELANFRTALAECLSRSDAEHGLRLCLALRNPWMAGGDLAEGCTWFDRFLAPAAPAQPSPVTPAIRARALAYRAELAFEQQDYPAAARFARDGLDTFRAVGEPGESGALRILALIALRGADAGEALSRADDAVAAARAAADSWEEGLALAVRAAVIGRLGRFGEARQAFESALDTLRDNNGWGVAQTLYGYGTLARLTGDHDGALRHLRTALGLYREIDAQPEMARCLAGIGRVALDQGDLALAGESLAESLRLSLATGQRQAISRGVEAFAELAIARGDAAAAARLAGAAAALLARPTDVMASLGAGPLPGSRRTAALLEPARRQLGDRAAEALAARGARLTAAEAVDLALGLLAAPAAPPAGGPAAEAAAGVAGAPTAGLAAGGVVAGPAGAPAADPAAGLAAGGLAAGPADGAADGSPAPGAAGGAAGAGQGGAGQGGAGQAGAGQAGVGQGPGGRGRAGGRDAAPPELTSREMEIAELIARGLSNRGIAAELTISPATAARHVANIFGKLGFTSRAQVAAWIAERHPGRWLP